MKIGAENPSTSGQAIKEVVEGKRGKKYWQSHQVERRARVEVDESNSAYGEALLQSQLRPLVYPTDSTFRALSLSLQ